MPDYSLTEIFGGKDTEAYKSYKEGQSSGKWSDYNDYLSKSGSGGSSTDMNSNIQNAIKMYQESVQPAVSSLQQSIPEIQQSFSTQKSQIEAEKAPLQERYENLINQIKGNQTTAENRQSMTTRNELARRGIASGSGLGEQQLVNAVNPITSEYTGLIKDTGLQQEADLRNLANQVANIGMQETGTLRDVQNQIAQILAGAGTGGIASGIQMAGINQNANQFNQSLALQQAAQELANKQYQNISLPMAQYDLNKPYYAPKTQSEQMLEDLQLQLLRKQLGQDSGGASGYKTFQPDPTGGGGGGGW
jgi:hypothetical protein